MRKLFFLGALLLPFCIGCEKVQEAIDDISNEVEVTTNFVINMDVAVPSQSDPDAATEISKFGGFDIINSPEVANRIGTPEQIKKVVIHSANYEYLNFSGNVDAIADGRFLSFDVNDDAITFPTGPVNVAEADLFNTIYNASGNFAAVSEYATQSKIIIFNYIGTCSKNPALFRIQVIVNATITVELDVQ